MRTGDRPARQDPEASTGLARRRAHLSAPMLIALIVVGAVGLLDAVIGPAYDLAVLFGLVVVLAVALLVRSLGRRRTVTLRADLLAALVDRSRRTGEPLDQVTDRAVATYLEALADPVEDGEPHDRTDVRAAAPADVEPGHG